MYYNLTLFELYTLNIILLCNLYRLNILLLRPYCFISLLIALFLVSNLAFRFFLLLCLLISLIGL